MSEKKNNYIVNTGYLKFKVHLKLLISQSKFSVYNFGLPECNRVNPTDLEISSQCA